METGKVLNLYMTLPDPMRKGHRTTCEDIGVDFNGIAGDINYEKEGNNAILLVSKITYDLIEKAELIIDKGLLLENIYVDIDLYNLKEGSLIEIGDTIFEVGTACQAYQYLYAFAPELPEIIEGKRGVFVIPAEPGTISVGDEVKILKEV